jgi:hypothetical protein
MWSGTGYAVMMPSGWDHTPGYYGDTWTGPGGNIGCTTTVITNLLSVEGSPEGVRDRMMNGLRDAGATADSSPTLVEMPAGKAYFVHATAAALGDVWGWGFYRGGSQAFQLVCLGTPGDQSLAIANSVQFGP